MYNMYLYQGWGPFHFNSSQFRKYFKIPIPILFNAFQWGKTWNENLVYFLKWLEWNGIDPNTDLYSRQKVLFLQVPMVTPRSWQSLTYDSMDSHRMGWAPSSSHRSNRQSLKKLWNRHT
jgi:hypothetical protein